jgi:hypothetical protein
MFNEPKFILCDELPDELKESSPPTPPILSVLTFESSSFEYPKSCDNNPVPRDGRLLNEGIIRDVMPRSLAGSSKGILTIRPAIDESRPRSLSTF